MEGASIYNVRKITFRRERTSPPGYSHPPRRHRQRHLQDRGSPHSARPRAARRTRHRRRGEVLSIIQQYNSAQNEENRLDSPTESWSP